MPAAIKQADHRELPAREEGHTAPPPPPKRNPVSLTSQQVI